jgi:hypothetical protein
MKTIKLAEATKKAVDKLRHPGQSYDGAIQEMLEELKRNNVKKN